VFGAAHAGDFWGSSPVSGVLAEREFGVPKGKSAEARLRLAKLAEILPVEAFTRAAIRHDLESRGQGIGPLGTLIAAQARRLDAVLVTRNLHEFQHSKRLSKRPIASPRHSCSKEEINVNKSSPHQNRWYRTLRQIYSLSLPTCFSPPSLCACAVTLFWCREPIIRGVRPFSA